MKNAPLRRALGAALLLAAGSVGACGQGPDEPSEPGQPAAAGQPVHEPASEGEPRATQAAAACVPAECVEGQSSCDGDTKVTCQKGKVVREDCSDEACKAQGRGPLLGCLLDDGDNPTCACGCTADDSGCEGAVDRFCGDDGGLYRQECTDELCKQYGYKGLKAGPGCVKTEQGAFCDCEPTCDASKITCNDSSGKAILTLCDGAKESTLSCDDVCAKDGQVASPDCAGVNESGDKVCFCGVSKCSSEGSQQCVGQSKVRFCANGVYVDSPCSDDSCKKAGFSGWSGTCGVGSSGKEVCLCN